MQIADRSGWIRERVISAGRIALVLQTCVACSAVTTVDLLPRRAESTAGNSGTLPHSDSSANTSTRSDAGNGGTASTRSDAGNGGTASTRTDAGSGGTATASTATGRGGDGGSTSSATSGLAGANARLGLVNRYDFSGNGTQVVDSISGMNGEVMGNAALSDTGQLTLNGDAQTYVKLPSWLLSSMTSASIVIWFTWHGGRAWQSVFNFGANASNTATPSEDVKAEFFFTPLMIPGPGSSLHVDMIYGDAIDFVNDVNAFPVDVPTMLAAVFDGEAKQISLYIDGVAVDSPKPTTQRLSELKDANCWLGQSQWAHDVTNSGNLRGSFDEVRIYRGALSAQQVQNLVMTDPNAI